MKITSNALQCVFCTNWNRIRLICVHKVKIFFIKLSKMICFFFYWILKNLKLFFIIIIYPFNLINVINNKIRFVIFKCNFHSIYIPFRNKNSIIKIKKILYANPSNILISSPFLFRFFTLLRPYLNAFCIVAMFKFHWTEIGT